MSGVSVQIDSLRKRLGATDVLRDLSLEVEPGEWLALLGPSGAGKTTLLRAIAGLEKPDAGRILFDGRDVAAVPPRNRKVGLVFQDLALWPYLTAEEHLSEITREPLTLLARFGLEGLEKRRPHELSGGQRQKLALARAVAHDPNVLLLDEPFTGLDPVMRATVTDLLAEYRRERGLALTTITVSHYADAVRGAWRIALLREGRIEQVGTLEELQRNPKSGWVAAYLSSMEFHP